MSARRAAPARAEPPSDEPLARPAPKPPADAPHRSSARHHACRPTRAAARAVAAAGTLRDVSPSTRRRVASNTAVQVAGKGAVLALGAASIAVLTRYLGPRDYGRYTLALMYMQLFGVLADVGLFTTVVREISQRPGAHRGARRQRARRCGCSSRSALIALAPASACCCPTSPTSASRSCSPAARCCLGMLTSSLVTVLQARLRMGRAVVGDVHRPRRRARPGRARGGARPRLLRGHGRGARGRRRRRSWSPGCSRAGRSPRSASAPTARSGASLLLASLPLGLALAINELYFRADTLIISLYEPYRGGRAVHARLPHARVHAGARNDLPHDGVPAAVATRSPTTSRRARRHHPELDGRVRDPRGCRSWRVAWCSRRPLVELVGRPRLRGRRDAAADPAGGRRAVLGQRRLRLRADRQGRQASALWLNVTALIFNVGLNFALVPLYGIVAAAIVTVASELAYPRRLLPPHATPLRLLPRASTRCCRRCRGRGDGRRSCGCCATAPSPSCCAARRRPLRGRRSTRSARTAARSCSEVRMTEEHPRRRACRAACATRRTWYRDVDPDGRRSTRRWWRSWPSGRAGACSTSGCGLGGYSQALGRPRLRLQRPRRRRRSTWRSPGGSACAPSATTAGALPLEDDSCRHGHPPRGARAPRGPRRRPARGRAGSRAATCS